jgi:uncharacterized protein (TIGR00251 family)
MQAIETTAEGIRLLIQAQPRASRTELVGVHNGALKIRVAAAPVEDAANDALLRFLAAALRVPRADLTLHSGAKTRRKVILVRRLTATLAEQRLGLSETMP